MFGAEGVKAHAQEMRLNPQLHHNLITYTCAAIPRSAASDPCLLTGTHSKVLSVQKHPDPVCSTIIKEAVLRRTRCSGFTPPQLVQPQTTFHGCHCPRSFNLILPDAPKCHHSKSYDPSEEKSNSKYYHVQKEFPQGIDHFIWCATLEVVFDEVELCSYVVNCGFRVGCNQRTMATCSSLRVATSQGRICARRRSCKLWCCGRDQRRSTQTYHNDLHAHARWRVQGRVVVGC